MRQRSIATHRNLSDQSKTNLFEIHITFVKSCIPVNAVRRPVQKANGGEQMDRSNSTRGSRCTKLQSLRVVPRAHLSIDSSLTGSQAAAIPAAFIRHREDFQASH
jgi:hypothetical protein